MKVILARGFREDSMRSWRKPSELDFQQLDGVDELLSGDRVLHVTDRSPGDLLRDILQPGGMSGARVLRALFTA